MNIRDRVLDLLEKSSKPLSSEEIAKQLKLTNRQVQEANTKLKRQKRIKSHGIRPCKFSFLTRELGTKLSTKKVEKKKTEKKKTTVKNSSSFKFNGYILMFLTEDSPDPKMLHDFDNAKELTDKFEELQDMDGLIDIAAYSKIGMVRKLQLEI